MLQSLRRAIRESPLRCENIIITPLNYNLCDQPVGAFFERLAEITAQGIEKTTYIKDLIRKDIEKNKGLTERSTLFFFIVLLDNTHIQINKSSSVLDKLTEAVHQ